MAKRVGLGSRELKAGGTFPHTDVLLRGYVAGLGGAVRKYAAKLSARGFNKEAQAQLAEAGAHFVRLLDNLRHQTSYLRRIGRAALRSDSSRADFDRIARARAKKVQAAPPPAPPEKAAVGG